MSGRVICMDYRTVYGVSETAGDTHGLCGVCMNRRMADVAKYRPTNLSAWRNAAGDNQAQPKGNHPLDIGAGLTPAALTNLTAHTKRESVATRAVSGETYSVCFRAALKMHAAAWYDACKWLHVSWQFSDATNAHRATCVAKEHVRWLARNFSETAKRQLNFTETYALWNLGYEGFKRRGFDITKCPTVTRRAISKGEKL